MEIIKDFKNCPETAKGSVVALGNFDGVHLGHKAVIEEALKIAKEKNIPSAVMTFEPHPITILRKDVPPLRITSFEQKAKLIEELGIDIIFCVSFTEEFSKTTATDFIEKILLDNLGIKHIVIGHDFIFGHNREGNADFIRNMSKDHNFELTQISAVKENESTLSSTLIRKALKEGNISQATEMLGHDYIIEGKVLKGDQRGRTIGFPTANIELKDHLRPAFGVYIVKIQLEEGPWLPAIANIGKRPTFDKELELLEVHIFDFSQEIYDKNLSVKILEFIRSEQKFDGLEALKEQIESDCKRAKTYFS